MNKLTALLVSPLLVTLAACGSNPQSAPNSETANADDFAARIGGNQASAPVVDATNAPTIAAPLPGAVEGPYAAGTLTDPNSSICGANLMGDFIGQKADEATRAAIAQAAAGKAQAVRFVGPGSATVQPDPTNPRLSMMVDNLGVIRDARCG